MDQQEFPFVIRGESAPHIAYQIFQSLDQNTLAKCRLVSNVWKGFVDCQTSLWEKVPTDLYINAAREGRLNICRLLIQNGQNKNPANTYGGTPFTAVPIDGC